MKLILIISILFLMTSCQKYLDKKQNTSLVVPQSLRDLQAILDDPGIMNEGRTPIQGEIASDEYFASDNALNLLESIGGVLTGSKKLYTWQYKSIRGGGNDWSASYVPVYNSNLVLEILEKSSRTLQNMQARDNVEGSALFYRAYYFLMLLWNYSKAYEFGTATKDWGIALRTTSNFNVPSVRANNESSYRKVIEDAKAAIPLLPELPIVPTRPSKAAAYGLLARCYLSMSDYENALLYADSSLRLKNDLMDFHGDEDIVNLGARGVFKKFNKEIIFYSEMNMYQILHNTSEVSRIDTLKYALYASTDLRKKAFYSLNSDGYPSFKGTYANYYSSLFSGLAVDELFLIRAEGYVRTGQFSKAINDIRALLSKRWDEGARLRFETFTKEDLLEFILNERQRELMMRGLRWMDLKRFNKEGASIVLTRIMGGVVYTLQPNSSKYALPIPEDIIELTGMPQNE